MNCIEGLNQLNANSVDLCITSPPYDDMRTYNDSSKWDFNVFKDVAQALTRVLKDGGVIMWNVGDATIDGSESGSSFRQALYFKDECGLRLHDTMIYEKTGIAFASGSKSVRYSQAFEYCFILSKGRPKTVNIIMDKPNKWAGYTPWGKATMRDKEGNLVERVQKPTPDFSPRNNIWRYNTGKGYTTKDNYAFEHPAMFPELLAKDNILSWSKR